jgi:hypothetical protein
VSVGARSPTPAHCARCGEPFGCGAGTGSCWCVAADVSAATLHTLESLYEGCLCQRCLRVAERGDLEPTQPYVTIEARSKRSTSSGA